MASRMLAIADASGVPAHFDVAELPSAPGAPRQGSTWAAAAAVRSTASVASPTPPLATVLASIESSPFLHLGSLALAPHPPLAELLHAGGRSLSLTLMPITSKAPRGALGPAATSSTADARV